MTDAPCKGCTDRTAGCHAACGRYRQWQCDHAAELQARRNAKSPGILADSYAINMVHKIKKEKRRRMK